MTLLRARRFHATHQQLAREVAMPKVPDDHVVSSMFGAISGSGLALHVECGQLMHARYYPSAGDAYVLERAVAHAKILKAHLDVFIAQATAEPAETFVSIGEAASLVTEKLAVSRPQGRGGGA